MLIASIPAWEKTQTDIVGRLSPYFVFWNWKLWASVALRKGATKNSDVLFFHQAVVYGSLKTEYAIDQLPGDKRLEQGDRTLYLY